jgi:hypothetical protein
MIMLQRRASESHSVCVDGTALRYQGAILSPNDHTLEMDNDNAENAPQGFQSV